MYINIQFLNDLFAVKTCKQHEFHLMVLLSLSETNNYLFH